MNVDDSEVWLMLDHDPPGPSRVDITRAMAEGRRRRTRRTSAIAGAAVLATAMVVAIPAVIHPWRAPAATTDLWSVLPSPDLGLPAGPRQGPFLPPPTSCIVERLPTPPGITIAVVNGGDPTGRYLVGAAYPHPYSWDGVKPALWDDGKLTTVEIAGDNAALRGVNSSGEAIGYSFPADAPGGAGWVYRGGTLTRLRGGDKVNPVAINAAGVIVGRYNGSPAVWRSADAEPTLLSDAPGGATGIDDDNTIMGTLSGAEVADQKPVVWYPDGSMHELPLPEGLSGGTIARSQFGWAVGAAMGPSEFVTLRWNVRTGAVKVFADMSPASPTEAGWIAGADASNVMLVTDSGTLRLPQMSAVKGKQRVAAISADGHIVGGQGELDDKDRTTVALRWLCS